MRTVANCLWHSLCFSHAKFVLWPQRKLINLCYKKTEMLLIFTFLYCIMRIITLTKRLNHTPLCSSYSEQILYITIDHYRSVLNIRKFLIQSEIFPVWSKIIRLSALFPSRSFIINHPKLKKFYTPAAQFTLFSPHFKRQIPSFLIRCRVIVVSPNLFPAHFQILVPSIPYSPVSKFECLKML